VLVQVRGLCHHYTVGSERVEVLHEVDFSVKQGEFVAIMGTSGSGKSTLLHILGCLIRPSSGEYLLGKTNVLYCSDLQLASIRANRIGFVFQIFHLLPEMTVYQNVSLPFLYNDINQQKSKDKVNKAIQQTGLSHRSHHKPMELSGGEMQRVAIARALAIEPELILADEPTGNLDSHTGKEILDLFKKLHQSGRTVIMVTHDKNVASESERILILEDGKFQK